MTAGPILGQVVETIGGAYWVRTPDGVLEASLRGRLKRGRGRGRGRGRDRVVVGDEVLVGSAVGGAAARAKGTSVRDAKGTRVGAAEGAEAAQGKVARRAGSARGNAARQTGSARGNAARRARSAGGGIVITEVMPRRTVLWRRPSWSRFAKVVAANLDRLIVVASVADPPPSTGVIDRMLVMGEAGGMNCRVVLNKVDLPGGRAVAAELASVYRAAGYRVTAASAVTGEGIAAFHALIEAGMSVLVGPSGAGKSSLLNAVEPGLSLRTRPVGRRSRAGRHTTVSSRLIDLAAGGQVADTPGFSDAGPGGVSAGDLDRCFPELRPFLGRCRFGDCAHLHEPACAVQGAVASGRVQRLRFESYRQLHAELQGLEQR